MTHRANAVLVLTVMCPFAVMAQQVSVLPDQTARIPMSNHDINHLICAGGEMGSPKFSEEKGIKVEIGGSDAYVKFLVKETVDGDRTTRDYVTIPSEFFIPCNGATYALIATPADIPAQTIALVPGSAQRAAANSQLLDGLAEEDRAVSITMSLLQDKLPASFRLVAADEGKDIRVTVAPGVVLHPRRRIDVEGLAIAADEYQVNARQDVRLDERMFLDAALGPDIYAITLDRLDLHAGETARLVVIRRGSAQ